MQRRQRTCGGWARIFDLCDLLERLAIYLGTGPVRAELASERDRLLLDEACLLPWDGEAAP